MTDAIEGQQRLADIKQRWEQLCDKFNDDKIPATGVALWAVMNVDELIALAEARTSGGQPHD